MLTISADERRRRLVARHRLAGTATDPRDAVRAVFALHASDPASVYLSVLARCSSCTLADVATAMYDERALVRWLAMRRTLFVVDRRDVPLVQAAAGTSVAASLRTQLRNRIGRSVTEPAVEGDVDEWLRSVAIAVEHAVAKAGAATGAELAAAEPRLRTAIMPTTPSGRRETVTTALLTLLGAEGRLVRGNPTGPWTSRQHQWEPIGAWWPAGVPRVDPDEARRELARRWLERFGPATVDDLQWWTGWGAGVTRRALGALPVEEVDLHGRPGIALPTDEAPDPSDDAGPVIALLPALDPTPMGWRHRAWFFALEEREVFDRAGNIGPTVWCDGRIVGSWAVDRDGHLRTVVRADIGSDAARAVESAAERLESRLDGATVTPAVRTPLERTLSEQP